MLADVPQIFRLFLRQVDRVSPSEWWLAFGYGYLLLLGTGLTGLPRRSVRRWFAWASVGLGVFIAARGVFSTWVDNDAMATFRYAHNFASGDGLVFNQGERIVGKTSLLWASALVPAAAIGMDLPTVAVQLGLLCLAGVVFLTWQLSQSTNPSRTSSYFSLALLMLAGNGLLSSYAVCGLATVPATLLCMTCLFWAQSKPLAAGCIGVCSALLEPGCLAFYVGAALEMLLRGQRGKLARLLLPLTFGVPALAIYWLYYGTLIPNHFVARAYGQSHLERGVTALFVTFLAHGLWPSVPVALVGLYQLRRRPFGGMMLRSIPLYLVYVAWMGGDGREGQLVVILLPFMFVLVEQGLVSMWTQRRWYPLGISLLALSLLVVPLDLLGSNHSNWGLMDAPRYDRNQSHGLRADNRCEALAASLGRAFTPNSAGARIATDCAGPVAYRTGLPVLDLSGDLDVHVARHRFGVEHRPYQWREGHAAYLLSKQVDLSEVPIWPERFAHLAQVQIGGYRLHWGIQRESVLQSARQTPGSQVSSVAEYVASHAVDPGTHEGACEIGFLEGFYFAQDRATEREQFAERLAEGPAPRSFHAVAEQATPCGWKWTRAVSLTREESADWLQMGPAFASWPRIGTAPEQSDISQEDMPLINSFRPSWRQNSTGRLQSPEFSVHGEVITLLLGGAHSFDRVFAGLLVEGQIVLRATGCDSNILRRQVWDVSPYRGKRARLLFVDEIADARGDLMVGDIRQWHRLSPPLEENCR